MAKRPTSRMRIDASAPNRATTARSKSDNLRAPAIAATAVAASSALKNQSAGIPAAAAEKGEPNSRIESAKGFPGWTRECSFQRNKTPSMP